MQLPPEAPNVLKIIRRISNATGVIRKSFRQAMEEDFEEPLQKRKLSMAMMLIWTLRNAAEVGGIVRAITECADTQMIAISFRQDLNPLRVQETLSPHFASVPSFSPVSESTTSQPHKGVRLGLCGSNLHPVELKLSDKPFRTFRDDCRDNISPLDRNTSFLCAIRA